MREQQVSFRMDLPSLSKSLWGWLLFQGEKRMEFFEFRPFTLGGKKDIVVESMEKRLFRFGTAPLGERVHHKTLTLQKLISESILRIIGDRADHGRRLKASQTLPHLLIS